MPYGVDYGMIYYCPQCGAYVGVHKGTDRAKGRLANAELRRGWGRCCCKSCAAQLREKKKPGYNPKRVAINNVRRQCWTDYPETERYPFSYDGADFDQWGDCEFGIHD